MALFAYLHGFASGPASRKGTALREALLPRGIDLALPDLNRPSFAELTLTGALAAVDEWVAGGDPSEPVRLVGSSFGGLVAARWAELHPDRADRLFLLCPGFDLPTRWDELYGRDEIEAWRRRGWYETPDVEGRPTRLHYGFYEDVVAHPPLPLPPCPVRILHGTRDEVVPIEVSRRYVALHPDASLVEVDDDHALLASIDRIAEEVSGFLAP